MSESEFENVHKIVQNEKALSEKAFEAFFKDNFSQLCAFCHYKFGFDLDLSKETVHSGFIKLWENRTSILPEQSLKAYMYKIVSNICLDLLRHRRIKNVHENFVIKNADTSTQTMGYDSADFKELKHDIDKAVLELPEQMRTVFVLSRYEGLKYVEIADQLGISVKTVETQMSRALVKLRNKLINYLSLFVVLSQFIG